MYLLTTLTGISLILFGVAFFLNNELLNVICGIVITITIIAVIIVPISRYISTARMVEYKTRKEVITQQRKTAVSELERVALTTEILNDNVWLKTCQYDINNKWLSIYFDKDILKLEPIQ